MYESSFNKRRWITEATNIVIFLTFGLPCLYLNLYGEALVKWGFRCDDDAIKYPLKENTVPTEYLFLFSLGIPILTIAVVECQGSNSQRVRKLSIYQTVFGFLFGGIVTVFFSDVCKFVIGRLRPNFIALCGLDLKKMDCGNSTHLNLIVDYECTGIEGRWGTARTSRLSFLSGHASVSCQAATFFILYIGARVQFRPGGSLFIPFLQLSAVFLALFTCLTRVTDFWHHPSDVLGGAILGITVQLFNCCWVMDLFNTKSPGKVSSEGHTSAEDKKMS